MSDVEAHRAKLILLAGKNAAVHSSKHGKACVALGRVSSISPTHVVISWRTGETIVPIDSITRIEEQAAP